MRMPSRRGVADDVPVGEHIVLPLSWMIRRSRPLRLRPWPYARLASRDVGLDVDDGGADELGDDFDDRGLGFEDWASCRVRAAVRPVVRARRRSALKAAGSGRRRLGMDDAGRGKGDSHRATTETQAKDRPIGERRGSGNCPRRKTDRPLDVDPGRPSRSLRGA